MCILLDVLPASTKGICKKTDNNSNCVALIYQGIALAICFDYVILQNNNT
ncbi:MAG: hypothetical protein ACI4TX_00635 [Christensenellales bacterium]